MRRTAVAIVAIVALIAPAGALAANPPASSPSQVLARRYAPVLRLVKQKEPCAYGEAYTPTNTDLVLGNPEVAFRGPWDKTNIVKVGPTAQDLARGLPDYYLDFPGTATSPGCTYDTWSHAVNKGQAPVTYAHIATDPAYPDRLALQYWFFYVFNDFNDKHEGDWEMMQLDFDAATPALALHTKPALVGLSQHEGAESAHWGESKLQILDATHPVVYPALGSHANYYTSALHLGRSAAQGVGCDNTTSPSRQVRPKPLLVPTAKSAYLRAYPWLGYLGHWGEQHPGFYNGPTGPNTKLQWTQPITWANTEWHDNSFTVPVGGEAGTTATGFFCGAIAAGSSLLTSLVGNPSPFFIALAVLFFLILWLTSRTSWQPSSPLHLEHRRRWGAILNATRRMYFGHLRLFLGIGLLFIPIGLLITGVQYLIFRLGDLNGLVNSAGSTNALVDLLAYVLGLVFTVFALAVVNAATAMAMVDIDANAKASAPTAYRKLLPKLLPLLGVVLIAAGVIAILGLISIGVLLGIWLIVRWAFLAQVVALEDVAAVKALRRSSWLVRGNWWRVGSLLLFVTVVALALGPLVGTLLLFATSASFNFINLIASAVYVFVLPFAAIAATYMYFDLRVARQEQDQTAESDDVLPVQAPTAPSAPAPR